MLQKIHDKIRKAAEAIVADEETELLYTKRNVLS